VTKLSKTIWKNLIFFLYVGFAKRLPCSYSRWGGRLYKSIRRTLARQLLAECGEGVNIETGADFGRGNNVWLGKFSDLGIQCEIHGEVHIGDHSFMGPGVTIWTRNHAFDRTDLPIMYQGYQPERPVFIGNDVWIGTRVVILPGVHIGNHVVIGAGSVVTKDIPDWAVAAGNPARVIKFRKTEEALADCSTTPNQIGIAAPTHNNAR